MATGSGKAAAKEEEAGSGTAPYFVKAMCGLVADAAPANSSICGLVLGGMGENEAANVAHSGTGGAADDAGSGTAPYFVKAM